MEGNKWAAVKCSVVGDLHVKKNLPNQDAIAFYELPGSSNAIVMAVSDGHGSEKCPRSDIGSALAVNTAIKVFIDSWSVMKSRLDESAMAERPSVLANIERHIRKDITKQLVDHWANAVDVHSASMPFPVEHDLNKRLLAYGATLTVVFLCEHFTTCLRLGDCEVLMVDRESKVNRIAPRNREQVGEDTDSLCMPDADKRFSVSFSSVNIASPNSKKLYLLCSDGYEKAFESNAGFEKSAIDFTNYVSSLSGMMTVEQELESWLRDYSKYSGDDVSVGLLFEKPQVAELESTERAIDNIDTGDRLAGTDAVFSDVYVTNHIEGIEFDRGLPPEPKDKA
jgi:serine/threonine protein phosphatase PrpC